MKLQIGLALVALTMTFAGCGGGGAGSSPSMNLSPSTVAPGSTYTESTIVVPAARFTQSSERRAQYISPSSLGLKVTVTDVPPTGSVASFTAIVTTYTLQTGSNTIAVPTPATAAGHTEDITYVAYDAAPVSNVIPPTAKAVDWGLATGLTIVPGKNSNSIALSGVVDTFAAPLAENGSIGTMSGASGTFAYLGPQTISGFGGSGTGVATLLDAGGNNIATADGGTSWPVVGAVPSTATTAATGVPISSVEVPGSCGSIGVAPHLQFTFAGGIEAATSAITTSTGALALDYDGHGGAGWYATVTAKAQTGSLVYTLSSLAVTSTGNSSYNCTTQTLAFNSNPAPAAVMTIVQHVAEEPYWVSVPASCSPFVNVYIGGTTSGTQIPASGVATSLGANADFTVEEVTPGSTQCLIEIQDSYAHAGTTTGANDPGGTTYVAVLPPGYTQNLTVP
jgi:hypothetical protein